MSYYMPMISCSTDHTYMYMNDVTKKNIKKTEHQ